MNDDEIIALFYDRDEQALTEIQNRFSGKCYCVAWRILKNHEDCVEYPFDVIFTGYNDTFESGTMELGAYEVFFVEVKPSSFTSGERVYTSDGYRKFYWSDGLYIFTLETSFAVGGYPPPGAAKDLPQAHWVNFSLRSLFVISSMRTKEGFSLVTAA